jgi:Adenylosuccinate synthase
MRGDSKIGTTSHGIGPTYEEKYSRNGIRIEDLKDLEKIRKKLTLISAMRRSELENTEYNNTEKIEELALELSTYWASIGQYVCRTETILHEMVEENREMVFEGGHGTLLDIDFGSYPYVTSSNTISGGVHTGSGVSLRKIQRIIGVVKSYTSRVGEGPFPTELHGKEAELLREAGGEYGTTTGRPRRVGWLDIPLVKYASVLNDVDELALTKLDVLGTFKTIKICTDYGSKAKIAMNVLTGSEEAEPSYLEMDSWGVLKEEEIRDIVKKGYSSIPDEMKTFIEKIELLSKRPVHIISIGKIRDSTIQKE